MPRLLALAIGVVATIGPPALLQANAAPATVLLLRPARPAPVANEALVRLRGELIAAGFQVQVADAAAASPDTRASIERAAAAASADAVVAILGDPARQSAEIWIVDRATGRAVARQVPIPAETERGAEVLSIRALELLRASLLEAALASDAAARPAPAASSPSSSTARPAAAGATAPRPAISPATSVATTTATATAGAPTPAAAPVPASTPPMAPAPSPAVQLPRVAVTRTDGAQAGARPPSWERSTWAVELGAVALGSFQGMPPSILPIVRGEARLAPAFLARLTLAGLGTHAQLTAPDDTVEVTHSFALAEIALGLRPGKRVQPFVSLGAGAARLTAEGRTSFPYEGKAAGSWSAVIDGGLGVRIGIGERFQLAGELHAEGAYPYPVVRFVNTTVAEEGRPTIVGGLSLIAWL